MHQIVENLYINGQILDQITRIEWRNVGSGSFATGSTITVFGADDQVSTDKSKDSITDVPTGSEYQETDTRKFYQRAGISNPLSQPSGLGDKVWDLTHASSYMTVDSDIVKLLVMPQLVFGGDLHQ